MSKIKRHYWVEEDEKALIKVVDKARLVEPKILDGMGGLWRYVQGVFFATTGIPVSAAACRKRWNEIQNREKEAGDVVTFHGVAFQQEKGMTDADRITALESRVIDLTNQVNNIMMELR